MVSCWGYKKYQVFRPAEMNDPDAPLYLAVNWGRQDAIHYKCNALGQNSWGYSAMIFVAISPHSWLKIVIHGNSCIILYILSCGRLVYLMSYSMRNCLTVGNILIYNYFVHNNDSTVFISWLYNKTWVFPHMLLIRKLSIWENLRMHKDVKICLVSIDISNGF